MLDRTIPPKVREFDSLTIPGINKEQIAAGVTLYTYNRPGCGILQVSILWNAGNANLSNRAASTFVAQMLREGTDELSGEEVARIFDNKGVSLKTINTLAFTGITALGEYDKVQDLLPLLSEIVLHPKIPEDTFSALQRSRISTLRIMRTKPTMIAEEVSSVLSFGAHHPYLLPVTVEEYEGVNVDDVRKCHSDGITQHAVHVFVSGDLDAGGDSLRQAIRHLCIGLSPQTVIPFTEVAPIPEAPQTRIVEMPHTIQSAVIATIPTIGRYHNDYADLRNAVIALGGYFGSRLMTNIREKKGLTYGIVASLIGYKTYGTMQISAQCDTKYTESVVEEIGKELDALCTTPMGNDELTCLRRDVMSTLATTLDTPLSIMDHYRTCVVASMPDGYFDAQVRSITTMTPERLRDVAARYLRPENLRIAIATAPKES